MTIMECNKLSIITSQVMQCCPVHKYSTDLPGTLLGPFLTKQPPASSHRVPGSSSSSCTDSMLARRLSQLAPAPRPAA